mmetsp:Transcript_11807/g.16050  ORF Transcript_11807/g.16050 Transcript_11807/m.16050 type:complete len:284 (-) Transcript_11807:1037-1888(-)
MAVVFLITASPRLGLIITGSLLLTVYFLLALIPLVGLQFNNVVVIYLITSIGLSVLYSAQISHTFLLVVVDSRLTPEKKRNVKARVSLARSSSSVLHSAIVTLLAISILGIGHKSYFFEVFVKLWLGIVFFGLLNAFFFVPVILSRMGPTPDSETKERQRRESLIKHMSSMNANQLSAMISQYDLDVPKRNPEGLDGDKLAASDMVYPLEAYVHKEHRESQVDVEMQEGTARIKEASPHAEESKRSDYEEGTQRMGPTDLLTPPHLMDPFDENHDELEERFGP